ncbi:unnamed protein product [Acidithrix sp. C25]|nr:unnamed protein product [Acidithrix sp. C25]
MPVSKAVVSSLGISWGIDFYVTISIGIFIEIFESLRLDALQRY